AGLASPRLRTRAVRRVVRGASLGRPDRARVPGALVFLRAHRRAALARKRRPIFGPQTLVPRVVVGDGRHRVRPRVPDARRGVPPAASIGLLSCGEYWSAFFVFVVGFLAWARVRADSAGGARVLTAMVGAVALAAPWIAFLTFGLAASRHVHDSLLIAAPSPL